MTFILATATVFAILALYVGYEIWSAHKSIERLLQEKAELEQKQRQQAVKIQTQKAEIKNAQIKQKNQEATIRHNAHTIDQQLYDNRWFRDDDFDPQLPSVQPNLSQPSRHDGNQAADSGTQSDL